MRAARIDEARAAQAVAEQDQVFTQHAHLARPVARIRREADRMPVAAQQLAHRRARADLGQFGAVGRRGLP